MTKIKICGTTDLKDALAAAEAGADAVGFVFAQSPRRITPKKAKEIISKLPPFISAVGVFVNQRPKIINKIIKTCGLNYVQLHGDETPADCRKIKGKVIKAFRVKDKKSLKAISRYSVSAVLLDTFSPEKYGGTGKAFNWELAVKAKKFGMPVILAGGLGTGNLLKAIRKVKPFAVDVSSGIESRPGKKDGRMLRKAVEIARRSCIMAIRSSK